MTGCIRLILGPMFSGKTTELVNRYNRYVIGGKKVVVIKYSNDTRYDEKCISTHNGIKVEALSCTLLGELDDIVWKYDVVCIDEIQFYADADIICDKWANDGIIVEACGLNGTFNRTPFEPVSRLVPLAEDITYVKAICRNNGRDATYSHLTIQHDNSTTEIIGGIDKYTALDRENYVKENNVKFDIDEYRHKLSKIKKIDISELDGDTISDIAKN